MNETSKGPGKAFRKGLSLKDLFREFPENATAAQSYAEQRWPGGKPICPVCGHDEVQIGGAHKSQLYRCRHHECRKRFSVKTGTAMQSSKLDCQTWAIAIYFVVTFLKGVSSMKLHPDPDITQNSARHVAHRIRQSWGDDLSRLFDEPAEVDAAYFGGKERNKHSDKRLNAGRATVGKTAVGGVKGRETNRISAAVVETTRKRELHSFLSARVEFGATIYTDELASYCGLPKHAQVNHGVGQYVSEQAHVNGMESFWAMMKRGYYGTYHRMSPKDLDRYVDESTGRHNIRRADTVDQIISVARGKLGHRLHYRDLIAPNGRSTGARAIA